MDLADLIRELAVERFAPTGHVDRVAPPANRAQLAARRAVLLAMDDDEQHAGNVVPLRRRERAG
jgi:hypothetical protein